MVDDAIAQLPAAWQAGHHPGERGEAVVHPVLVRADTAGAVRGFIEGLVARNCEFSVGGRVSGPLDAAIAGVGDKNWVAARNANGIVRRHDTEPAPQTLVQRVPAPIAKPLRAPIHRQCFRRDSQEV